MITMAIYDLFYHIYIYIYVCLSGFCEWWTYVTIQAGMYGEARPSELLFLRCFPYCLSPSLELNKQAMLVDQWATKIHLFLSPQHWASKDTILHSAFCSLGSRDWKRDHKGKLNHLTRPWEIIICLKSITMGKVHFTVICHQKNKYWQIRAKRFKGKLIKYLFLTWIPKYGLEIREHKIHTLSSALALTFMFIGSLED